MARVPAILANEFDRMLWVDPKQVLVNLRWLELKLPQELDEKVRSLRTNQLKEWREAREAALFAYGISTAALEMPVKVTKAEKQDFDCVLRWTSDEGDHFFPVQLKELPPAEVNADVTLDDLFEKLSKYSGEKDLSVVISLNRRARIPLTPWLGVRRPRVKEVWYMGCESADQSTWFLYGSVLEATPRKYRFRYPEGTPNVA